LSTTSISHSPAIRNQILERRISPQNSIESPGMS
jgi:hypothetical protein